MATYAGRYDEPMLRRVNGRLGVATGITVRVYESDGTTEATLYTDRTKATTTGNPVAVDASGNLEFFAEPGTYVLSILESDAQVATNIVTVHSDPAENAAAGHDHDADYASAAQGALADTALQDATDVVGAFTGTPDGTQYLRDDGTLATPAGGGGGATNLTWTAATSTVASDTGTDAVLTAVDASNPGLMTVAQKIKLDGIETGATADQTAAEVAITDAGAHYTGTDVEAALQEVPTLITNATSDVATAAQGALADTAVQPAAIADMVTSTDVTNIVVLTEAAYTALALKDPDTLYFRTA